jgi:uncharacterized integral membrane protein
MRHIKALAVFLVVVLVVIVAVQNYENLKTPVVFSLNLMFFRYESPAIPLACVAVITFLVGIVSMGLFGITERFLLKRRIKTLQGEARERDKELNSLRNLSVATEETNSD